TVATVFSSGVDTMEGVVGNLSPERDVVLTPGAVTRDGAAITEGITMNPNGSITVKRGMPKGTYTYEYTICQKDVPTNCDTAKVSFEVIEAHIFAKDDGVWEVGTEGALTPSVLNNDIIGERVGIAPSEVSITKTNGKPVIDDTKMVMNEDGRISVKKNIPEGTYTYYYTITEKANISNTASAAVTIRVVSFSAQDDEFDITNDKTKEFKTESVLANDELNKKKNPSPVDDVILTKGEAKDAERNPTNALIMNDDGTITIAPNTPDGVYTYTYTICKKSASTECKSAEAVIKLLPALIANDDDFTANPINPLVKEGIAGNVLDNDRYADGNALEHLDKVKITMLEDKGSRANIEQNGNVVIPQGAPAGEYTLKYNLCMKDHPTICAEANVKIVILEDKPIVIHNGISANGDGVNDGFMIEHIEGYPKNNLKIFNRWGVLVYEKDGYTNSEPFDGHSNGRATISADSKLPQGTYYYILEYQDTAEQTHTKKGWLYLKY
ncbi:gliding motility-associated C-terminal domain-containing protein, partial [Capnocytophaga sp. CM59]|uniref:gliding motility-associated C-terminal domain-containing protein n=1 Tax=Capnocytophaga sp. CM59 TaxID=936370 RepID=UPI00027C4897